MIRNHWFKFQVKGSGQYVYDCIPLSMSSMSEAEKILKGKWPSLTYILNRACSDTPPSWYK
ncbi:MAG: hypothetical protein IKC23_10840 [Fibrobacter sp.]|nr:hypothetical protein [Fibrobacter sp.]MBR2900099.1 hypothetical protein [Fibrobacter sp.]